jgi:hypothetical protein
MTFPDQQLPVDVGMLLSLNEYISHRRMILMLRSMSDLARPLRSP